MHFNLILIYLIWSRKWGCDTIFELNKGMVTEVSIALETLVSYGDFFGKNLEKWSSIEVKVSLPFLPFHKKVIKFSLLTCYDWIFFNVWWFSFWFFMLHKDWKLETKNLNTRILVLFFEVQSCYNWSPIVLKKVSISLQKWSPIGLQLRLFLFSQLVTIPVNKMIVIFVKPKA